MTDKRYSYVNGVPYPAATVFALRRLTVDDGLARIGASAGFGRPGDAPMAVVRLMTARSLDQQGLARVAICAEGQFLRITEAGRKIVAKLGPGDGAAAPATQAIEAAVRRQEARP